MMITGARIVGSFAPGTGRTTRPRTESDDRRTQRVLICLSLPSAVEGFFDRQAGSSNSGRAQETASRRPGGLWR